MGRRRHKRARNIKGLEAVALGFATVWTAHLGRRYGILQRLAMARGSLGAAGIARACGLHPPAAAAWLEAAHALGLVERTGGRYRLTRTQRALLVDEEDPRYLGGQFSYLALRSLDYGGFDGLFLHGAVPAPRTTHLAEAAHEATKWDHTLFMEVFLPRFPGVRSLLSRGARVLDMGCGTGEWNLRMAKVFRKSRFVGIDPNRSAVGLARRRARELKVNARAEFVVGAGASVRRLGSFDLVFMGEVLYGLQAKARVLRDCRGILRTPGYLVIAEGLIDRRSNPREPLNQILRAMDMDFALQGARLLSKPDLMALLGEAGFRTPRFLHGGGGLWFAVAKT